MNNFFTKYLSFIQKIKKRPLFLVFTILCTFVISLASFTDSVKKINLYVHTLFEPNANDISGYWLIEETEKTYETYIQLKTLGDQIVGTTTIFFNRDFVMIEGIPVTAPINDAKLLGNILSFSTNRKFDAFELDFSSRVPHSKRVGHEITTMYQGEINGDEITLYIKSDNGKYYDEVKAKKIDTDSAEYMIKTKRKQKYELNN